MSPSRSTNITIINDTSLTLTLKSSDLDHGEWSQPPATVISPGQQATAQADSDGIMTGDEGALGYSSDAGQFTFSFDNPYSGSNSYDESAAPGYTVTRSGGGGDNASVTFIVKAD